MGCNVLEIIPTLLNGGAEALVREHALKTDRTKICLRTVVVWNYKDATNSIILKENNIQYDYIYKKSNLISQFFHRVLGSMYLPYKLKKIIKNKEIDCIHIHLHLLPYFKKISKHMKGKKLLYTVHSEPSKHFLNEREIEIAKYLIKENQLQFIALHDDMKKELNEMFGVTNTIVVKNGIDFERFTNVLESKEDIRKSIGIPEDAFVVGHNGRFIDVKNHRFLVKVFYELCKHRNNAHLLLIGFGPLIDEVKTQVMNLGLSEKVTILSNRADIPRLLKAMDVFVFPSKFEGLPISLVEAQVASLRCLVSDRVSEYAFLSRKTIPMALEKTAEEWSKAVLDETLENETFFDLAEYDMKKEIRRLEMVYMDGSDGNELSH